MRTSRKTDFHQKNETSAGLKITLVDMTYPGQRPELSSLYHHFLLVNDITHEQITIICRLRDGLLANGKKE